MNTVNWTWSHETWNDNNPQSNSQALVSATTRFAMRALTHQHQVDFFAKAIQKNLTFEEAYKIIFENPGIVRNKTLYDFLISRKPSRHQKKQLDQLFRK